MKTNAKFSLSMEKTQKREENKKKYTRIKSN